MQLCVTIRSRGDSFVSRGWILVTVHYHVTILRKTSTYSKSLHQRATRSFYESVLTTAQHKATYPTCSRITRNVNDGDHEPVEAVVLRCAPSKGAHVTTHRCLLRLNHGIWGVFDTPSLLLPPSPSPDRVTCSTCHYWEIIDALTALKAERLEHTTETGGAERTEALQHEGTKTRWWWRLEHRGEST